MERHLAGDRTVQPAGDMCNWEAATRILQQTSVLRQHLHREALILNVNSAGNHTEQPAGHTFDWEGAGRILQHALPCAHLHLEALISNVRMDVHPNAGVHCAGRRLADQRHHFHTLFGALSPTHHRIGSAPVPLHVVMAGQVACEWWIPCVSLHQT